MILLFLSVLLPGCADALTLDVDATLENEFVAYVQSIDQASCSGASVVIRRKANGLQVLVRRDGQNAQAFVENKEEGFAMVAAFLSVPRVVASHRS